MTEAGWQVAGGRNKRLFHGLSSFSSSKCVQQIPRTNWKQLGGLPRPRAIGLLHVQERGGLGLPMVYRAELGAMTFVSRGLRLWYTLRLRLIVVRDRPPPIAHVARRCFLQHTRGQLTPRQKLLRTSASGFA